ncbi:conserved hypothetical protein [Thermosulfidibacter takaii ABI70S6]|uniref:DUF302 domain-containing protein n=1 Tax=Thermosulfidibacter takaii (strain DSM 17441 / JCM 13301 / NBRC 103674 / ABI70S6) TaxID=1298851 RepID=A0A0S3QUU9_THET7|nr:DUF302 domain-containing protein [Thermosulfidibacter takaii]BAT72102.1 conserved hypothetical protein [Thermosulfidibacter takaii ABI70S6]
MGLFLLGFILGVVVLGLVMWKVMPNMMIITKPCKYSVDEAVEKIENRAKELGWSIPHIYDIQKNLEEKGYKVRKVKILSLCKPEFAYAFLSEKDSRKIAAGMPCRIALCEGEDGKVYVYRFNTGLMGKMFGGRINELFTKVATEEEQILKEILQ